MDDAGDLAVKHLEQSLTNERACLLAAFVVKDVSRLPQPWDHMHQIQNVYGVRVRWQVSLPICLQRSLAIAQMDQHLRPDDDVARSRHSGVRTPNPDRAPRCRRTPGSSRAQ